MDGLLKVWAKAQGGRGQEKSEWVALAGGQQPRRGMAEARPLMAVGGGPEARPRLLRTFLG